MKKFAIAMGLMASFAALANGGQQGPGGAGTGGTGGPGVGTQGDPGNGQQFQQRKNVILQRIQDRQQRLGQFQQCVQAAQDHNALRACREQFGPHDRDDRERHD